MARNAKPLQQLRSPFARLWKGVGARPVKRRCVLHIGTEKTATTLLQNWLYENEKALSEQGFAITRSAGFPNNRKLSSYFENEIEEYLRSNNVHSEVEKEEFFRNFEGDLDSEICAKSARHETFIFSSEHFHSRLRTTDQIADLKSLLDKYFDDYRIICYFREQSEVRRSLYSTVIKINGTMGVNEFRKGVSPRDHYFNYHDFFMKWEDVFGKESLYPRMFGKKYFCDDDIRKDFVKTAIPEIDVDRLTFETESSNESLSEYLCELFRIINSKRPPFIGRHADPTPRFFKRLISRLDFLDNGEPINDPRQMEMYKMFHESNLKFFSRYFGVEENLFDPPEVRSKNRSEMSFSEAQLRDLIGKIVGTENLIVVEPGEIDHLRNLAVRLRNDGSLGTSEAAFLLKLAQRARPQGGMIEKLLDEMSAR